MKTLLVWLLLVSAVMADRYNAVCRVRGSGGGVGSGTIFEQRENSYCVLTNAHVVGSATAVGIEIWRDGHQSKRINGKVIFRQLENGKHRDIAIVEIPASEFEGHKPSVIPLAPCGTKVSTTVRSLGCANGGWATGWQGHIRRESGPVYEFVPAPLGGRSGSALFTPDGKSIVGLVTWRAGDNSHGLAQTLEEIYRAFEGRKARTSVRHATAVRINHLPELASLPSIDESLKRQAEILKQIQSCGPGGCRPHGFGGFGFYRSPPRRDPSPSPTPPPGGGGLFPTYPYTAPVEGDTGTRKSQPECECPDHTKRFESIDKAILSLVGSQQTLAKELIKLSSSVSAIGKIPACDCEDKPQQPQTKNCDCEPVKDSKPRGWTIKGLSREQAESLAKIFGQQGKTTIRPEK